MLHRRGSIARLIVAMCHAIPFVIESKLAEEQMYIVNLNNNSSHYTQNKEFRTPSYFGTFGAECLKRILAVANTCSQR